MKVIGDPNPAMSNNLGGVEPEPETCAHKNDGMRTTVNNIIISNCEYCGAPLRAEKIDTELLEETGELHVKEWCEDWCEERDAEW